MWDWPRCALASVRASPQSSSGCDARKGFIPSRRTQAMATERETIVGAFRDRAEQDGSRVALHKRRDNAWVSQTWGELAHDVFHTAAALTRAGVAPGDRVILVSPNRYEWIVCDLAIQFARGVHVPVHNALSGPQITYQIRDSGAK